MDDESAPWLVRSFGGGGTLATPVWEWSSLPTGDVCKAQQKARLTRCGARAESCF